VIGRYRIVRGARPVEDPLPEGLRQDTRKHTRHILRPSAELVARFLRQPSEQGFAAFRAGYLRLLEQRFQSDRAAFDALRDQARSNDVFLGCNCPTAKQPHVRHCHTYLALGFLAEHYPELKVRWP
jgi:uncharacterized protein YeaO (DUF488 family)